jgi:hypothetical protein
VRKRAEIGVGITKGERVIRDVLARAFVRVRTSVATIWNVFNTNTGEMLVMANKFASEELLAAPLPELIKNLGIAVAQANKEVRKADDEMRYTIQSAEIELKVTINVETSSEGKIDGGAKISVFNVNASYSKTYGFKEEASSTIKLTLAAVPVAPAAVPAAPRVG